MLRILLACALCWPVLALAPVRAQENAGQEQEVPSAKELEALRERYRPSIHPGDPLRLVGNEQDGNDLRSEIRIADLLHMSS